MSENGTVTKAGSSSLQPTEIPQLPNQVNHAPSTAQHLSSEKTARARPLYAQHSNTKTGAASALATECDLRDCAQPAPSEERIVSPIVAPLTVGGDAPTAHVPEASKFSRPTALRRFSLISQSLTSLIASKVLEGNSFEDTVVVAVAPHSLWHRARNSINRTIQPCIISSDGKFRLIFDFIHFVVILGTLLFTPFQVLFKPDVLSSSSAASSYHTVHFGVDIIGLIRAAYANYRAQRVVQGGSTLTQQLAKNILFTQIL